jgi:hypothetical protein
LDRPGTGFSNKLDFAQKNPLETGACGGGIFLPF